MLLVADVGGTKTDVALIDSPLRIVRKEAYVNSQYACLEEIITLFLGATEKVEKGCFAVAGAVQNNRVMPTNLSWEIDGACLAQKMGIKHIHLINDLEAYAWGIECLESQDFFTLNEGSLQKGNRALIASGTGLGEVGLFEDKGEYRPFATEGGHTDFAPRSEIEMELLRFLKKRYEHVSYERVLSGEGLYLLYRFLIDHRLEKEAEGSALAFAGRDPAQVISERAIGKKCTACRRALEWFVSFYGSEAGNLALKMLARGGVYVGGSVARKIQPFLQTETFMKGFIDKGRFSQLLSTIPVKLILSEDVALLGAARAAIF